MDKTIKELRQELADYKRRVREDENDIAMMRDIISFKREEIELIKDENETLAFENKNFGDYLANEGISHDDINSIALKGEYPYN